MCLDFTDADVKKYKKNVRGDKISVKKSVDFDGDDLVTPHRSTIINGGWFQADVEPEIFDASSIYDTQDEKRRTLYGGAIHALRASVNKEYALDNHGSYILNCYGLKKDLIAVNDTDIAFSKIFIPAAEISRVKKIAKKEYLREYEDDEDENY